MGKTSDKITIHFEGRRITIFQRGKNNWQVVMAEFYQRDELKDVTVPTLVEALRLAADWVVSLGG